MLPYEGSVIEFYSFLDPAFIKKDDKNAGMPEKNSMLAGDSNTKETARESNTEDMLFVLKSIEREQWRALSKYPEAMEDFEKISAKADENRKMLVKTLKQKKHGKVIKTHTAEKRSKNAPGIDIRKISRVVLIFLAAAAAFFLSARKTALLLGRLKKGKQVQSKINDILIKKREFFKYPLKKKEKFWLENKKGDVQLVEIMSSYLPGLREKAVLEARDMIVSSGKAGIGVLRKYFKDGKLKVKLSTINVMFGLDREIAFSMIKRLSKSRKPQVRAAAVMAIGESRGPEGIGILGKLLNDRDKHVRAKAVKTLKKLNLLKKEEFPEKEKKMLVELSERHDGIEAEIMELSRRLLVRTGSEPFNSEEDKIVRKIKELKSSLQKN